MNAVEMSLNVFKRTLVNNKGNVTILAVQALPFYSNDSYLLN